MFGRATLAMFGRGQLLCKARYFNSKIISNLPKGINKNLEQEKIDPPTLMQEKTLSVAMQNKYLVGVAGTKVFQPQSKLNLLLNHLNIGHSLHHMPVRQFHAKGSKVKYMDFRYRFSTCHFRSHLLIIRRQKMKKHRRRKWRKKYKCLLAKQRLMREISKEKAFRVELLTMIKRAEQFDPREYALNKIRELNSKPRELTREERLEDLKELIRKNRYQVSYIKPKHKRPETYGLDL